MKYAIFDKRNWTRLFPEYHFDSASDANEFLLAVIPKNESVDDYKVLMWESEL